MMHKKIVMVAAVACLSIMLSNCSRPSFKEDAAVEIGRSAPEFKLPDLQGEEVALSQFKGKVVLLDFWASWCGPCRMTMPVIEKLEKEFGGALVVLAVNLQDPKGAVEEYVQQQAVNSRILLDEEGKIGSAYGAESIPMQFLIDKNGVLRHVQMGYKPRMASELRAQIERLR